MIGSKNLHICFFARNLIDGSATCTCASMVKDLDYFLFCSVFSVSLSLLCVSHFIEGSYHEEKDSA
jgi:hypothetical protein